MTRIHFSLRRHALPATALFMALSTLSAWADDPQPTPPPPEPVPAPSAVEVPPPPAEPATPPAAGARVRPIIQRFLQQGAVQVHPGAIAETGKFWLGMMCLPVPEVLRSQMALPAGTGLVVHDVAPDGPAAKAGIQRNDILLHADAKPLPDGAALGRIANEKGANSVEFKLLRGGKEQTVQITPAERPPQPFNVLIPQGDDHQAIEQWIGQLRQLAERPNGAPGRPLRLRILRPAPGTDPAAQRPFPADLNVKVTRDGNGPTKIEVHQGDKHWQVTSDDLAKLPETVRPYIENMMSNMGTAGHTTAKPGVVEGFQVPEVEFQPNDTAVEGAPPVGGAATPPPPPAPPAVGTQSDRNAEINQLRDQLKDVQRKLDQIDKEKK